MANSIRVDSPVQQTAQGLNRVTPRMTGEIAKPPRGLF
jgi:hypothetical protein